MKINDEIKLDYSDVLIVPRRTKVNSRSDVKLNVNYTFKNSKRTYDGVPIMAANMDGVGTFEMANELDKYQMFTCLVKHYSEENLVQYFNQPRPNVAVSVGSQQADLEKLRKVNYRSRYRPEFICIDVANGYTDTFMKTISMLRGDFPISTLIAGNVVTPEITEELIKKGVDIVKVGIGPGSVCTTRIQTGVGYPQLSAVAECARVAHILGAHVIADGGCTCPGDVAKAFGAGADFVMLGGMFAGHDEGGGNITTEMHQTNKRMHDGHVHEIKKFVEFYGMSSQAAMEKHHGGVSDYRSSEGKIVKVPYRGPVSVTVKDLLGGLRSTCSYVDASCLSELHKKVEFIRCNNTHNRVFGG